MIHSFAYAKKKIGEVGEVIRIRESLVWVRGLPGATVGEGVSFEKGLHGRVTAFEGEVVEVMVFGSGEIEIGDKVARTGSVLRISVGDGILGRTVNYAGHLLEGTRGKSGDVEGRMVEVVVSDLSQRAPVKRFLGTGVRVVDVMMPLAKGQRELIVGDRKSGKTHFALQAILAQVRGGSVGVIALVGKKKYEIRRVERFLEEYGIRDRSVVVAAEAEASAGEIFMVPYTAMAVAEHFKDDGQDVIVVLDDLSTHAKRYRELSLLGGRFPGRDSYPGDIFYIHSRLLERAGSFKVGRKEVAITCLPIVETVEGNLTGYIQTNLMSMTDGHLFFDAESFYRGMRPALNVFLSVTRVGRQAQPEELQAMAKEVRRVWNEYERLRRFLRFGPELTEKARWVMETYERLRQLFTQVGYEVVEWRKQVEELKEVLG